MVGERRVYILLTDTGTLFTRMIKLYTKKEYNHASISFDENFSEVYSFGRKTPRNPFIGGFVKENMREGLFRNATCVIYSCPITEAQFLCMKKFLNEIERHKHLYRYNLLGLFALMLQKPVVRERAYFCSEFVATVLSKGNIANFEKPLSFVSPHDLQQIDKLQLEFQGELASLYDQNDEQITQPWKVSISI